MMLEEYFHQITATQLHESDLLLLQQSHDAYLAQLPDVYSQDRALAQLTGDIVTDTESDTDLIIDVNHTQICADEITPATAHLIRKRRLSVKRIAKRRKLKLMREHNPLRKQTSTKLRGIIHDSPDIGHKIEQFVESRNVGADAWRRTGVLTFDGNVKNVKSKVTYMHIKQHLEQEYKRKFSYIIQLCIARNRRHRAAANYRGVAHVVSRRARKGFQLRFNPDMHWSSSLYMGLNYLQYRDGTNILNLNRDDAAGFRLDTLTTNHQYSVPTLKDHPVLTTHTDYVNKYPSVLQTTSYNFTKTSTTSEFCVGVVKAQGLYEKNPAQHAADLMMLQSVKELEPVFYYNKCKKLIDCIRVDGAMDEGPSHEEVRYWWTRHHYNEGKLVTIVTTRSSGASFLNRVELQNGCLTRAHSNLFIPSTLAGSCLENGQVNRAKLAENLSIAMDVYINRCNNCPCGDSVIHLYRGMESDELQSERNDLLIFLKGTATQKKDLQKSHPDVVAKFEKIITVQKNHHVIGMPSQYCFYLLCCFKPDCPHPLCSQQDVLKDTLPQTWYPEGPPLTYIPLPKIDPSRPWGNDSCTECNGFCSGHYLRPPDSFSSLVNPVDPPSTVIKAAFIASGGTISEHELRRLARSTLLTEEEVRWWWDHLVTIDRNRKEGAKKAAETRK